MSKKAKTGKPDKWKATDPLFRGDGKGGVVLPDPDADPSIVRHVLYLGGAGRSSPYHSATEHQHMAQFFAGRAGQVYRTTAATAEERGARHRSRSELLSWLKGKGFGDARWNSALDVMTARRYVEQWAEHLIDFRPLSGIPSRELCERVNGMYEEG